MARGSTNPLIVRHSAFGADSSEIIQLIDKVDDALKASGLYWISIRPTFFMQNLMMTSPSIQGEGNIYWDWADGKVGMIDIRDIADSAVGLLSGKAEEGKEYILTGPQSISIHDVADSFSKTLTRI